MEGNRGLGLQARVRAATETQKAGRNPIEGEQAVLLLRYSLQLVFICCFVLFLFAILFCSTCFCFLLVTLITMVKCQRIVRDMLFRAEGSREIVTSKVAAGSTSSTSFELNDIQKANVDWKDAWYALFDWIEFNRNWGGFFVKFAKKVVASMC